MMNLPYTAAGKMPFDNADDILQLLKTDDVFKNQIKIDQIYKIANKQIYQSVLIKMKELLKDINTEIERLKS